MNNIQATLENLIKTNNGFFKSEKQAKFLLSELKKEYGNVFTASAFGNSVALTYAYDEKGITEKTNTSAKTNKTAKVWERKIAGVLSLDDKKTIAHYKREIKKLEKSIFARDEALKKGEYEIEALYIASNSKDLERLAMFKKLLNDYQV